METFVLLVRWNPEIFFKLEKNSEEEKPTSARQKWPMGFWQKAHNFDKISNV